MVGHERRRVVAWPIAKRGRSLLIRRFKPLHGWRAFFGEVGVIVLGVLVALGAQQLAEKVADRKLASEAMDALRSDVREQNWALISYEIVAPCVFAQIDAIEKRLIEGDRTPVERYRDPSLGNGFVINVPTAAFSTSTWDSIQNNDQLRLLDPEVVGTAGTYYARFENLRHFTLDAIDNGAALNALSVKMPSDEAGQLRAIERLELMRKDMARLELIARQGRQRLAAVGLLDREAGLDENFDDNRTIRFCRDHHFPLAKPQPIAVETR